MLAGSMIGLENVKVCSSMNTLLFQQHFLFMFLCDVKILKNTIVICYFDVMGWFVLLLHTLFLISMSEGPILSPVYQLLRVGTLFSLVVIVGWCCAANIVHVCLTFYQLVVRCFWQIISTFDSQVRFVGFDCKSAVFVLIPTQLTLAPRQLERGKHREDLRFCYFHQIALLVGVFEGQWPNGPYQA